MSSIFSSPFMAKSPLNQVDPDAPGTKGKPGYEPKVKRRELDKKGKKIYDDLRKENRRLLKSGMTQKQIDDMNLKKMREKNKDKYKEQK
jgi:hypothetical protein